MTHEDSSVEVQLANMAMLVRSSIERRNVLLARMYADGWSFRELAALANLSPSTVHRIIRGKDS